MKKLLLLLLIAPIIGNSQSQKKIEKETEIQIINRYGFDETATFAFYVDDINNNTMETAILLWEEALLSNGLKLGSWKVEENSVVVDADYYIEKVSTNPRDPFKLTIQDVSNDFKVVATVFFGGKKFKNAKKWGLFFTDIDGSPYRNYVIKKLLESNKR